MGHVSYSEQIEASPDQIWTLLTDVTRLPEWSYKEGRFPYPVEARYGADQTEGVGTIWIGVSTDGQIAKQKITAWEPGKQLVYELQEMEHAALQMAQTNTFELESQGDTTTVTWSVDWQLTGGFSLSSLILRLTANGSFEEMIAGSLENLKQLVQAEARQAAETGQKPEDETSSEPEKEPEKESAAESPPQESDDEKQADETAADVSSTDESSE